MVRLTASLYPIAAAMLALVSLAPSAAQAQTRMLVGSAVQPDRVALSISLLDLAQAFTTGGNAAGYTLSDVQIRMASIGDSRRYRPRVSIAHSTTSNLPGSTLANGSLVTPGTLEANELNTFAASGGGIALEPNTTYFVLMESDSWGWSPRNDIRFTASHGEDASGAPGWSIANRSYWLPRYSNGGAWTSTSRVVKLRVNGRINNNLAAGEVTLSGKARVGETLTASRVGFSDEDGLTSPTYSYRWIRIDGGREIAVGTDSSTYSPVAADAGKRVKARVSFNDDLGNGESVESAAVPVRTATPATCPAFSLPARHEELWTGTVTVAAHVSGGTTVGHGYVSASNVGSLTAPRNFAIGSNDYVVGAVSVSASGANAGTLTFDLNAGLVTAESAAVQLRVCGESYALADAEYDSNSNAYSWPNAGLDWSSVSSRLLYLTGVDTTGPVLESATADDQTLVMTFGEDLDEDSVPGEDAFTIRVDGSPRILDRTLEEPVTVSGSTVTLRLATGLYQGEVVHLDYRLPTGADTQPIRDVRGNDAPQVFNVPVVNESSVALQTVVQTPAPEPAAGTVDWSTSLTVGNRLQFPESWGPQIPVGSREGTEYERGYRRHGCDSVSLKFPPSGSGRIEDRTNHDACYGSISDDTMEVDGHTFYLHGVFHHVAQDGFEMRFKRNAEDQAAGVVDISGLLEKEFIVNGTTFRVSERAGPDGDEGDSLIWSAPAWTVEGGEGWPVGQKIWIGIRSAPPLILQRRAIVPLTAEFLGLPEGHGGETIEFELEFSEELDEGFSYKTLAGYREEVESVFEVTGGRIVEASRKNSPSNLVWNIGIEPDAGAGDVTVTLPATTDCEETGAICTRDDNPLASAVSATVPRTPAEQPLTASFVNGPPGKHDGASKFSFRIEFSENLETAFSYKTLRDRALSIMQDGVQLTPKVSRVHRKDPARYNQVWDVEVTPGIRDDISITFGPSPACNSEGAICTEGGKPLASAILRLVAGPPGLAVADATVREAAGASLDFVVTLSTAATETVTVNYTTSDGTAVAGVDYTATSGTLTFSPDDTEKTVSVEVLDDKRDEGSETMTLTLSNPSGGDAWLKDATATGTIENSDPLPRAWAVRFGRTVGSQVVDALESRLASGGRSHVTVGGMSLLGGHMLAEPEVERLGLPEWEAREKLDAKTRSMSMEDLIEKSAFHLSTGNKGAGSAAFAAWGRFVASGFDGEENDLALDGNVTTGLLGTDAEWERLLAGVMLSQSKGDGSYRSESDSGKVESSLTGVYPYAKLALNERVSMWGLAGTGSGELTLRPDGDEEMKTDLSLRVGAVGVKGQVLDGSGPSGVGLSVRSDAMWVETKTEEIRGMVETEGEVSRLRLIVDAERAFAVGEGGTLTPSGEIGVRIDGGDAETGTGLELGAGARYAAGPVMIEGQVRALVAHEESGYEEWGASAAVRVNPSESGRGMTLFVTPAWGSAGSEAERLWGARDASELGHAAEFQAKGVLKVDLGYGIGVPGTRGVVTPYAGLSLEEGAGRAWRTGARWNVAWEATLGLEAMREESREEGARDALVVRAQVRW